MHHNPVFDFVGLINLLNKVLFPRDNKLLDSYCYLLPSGEKDCLFWLHILMCVKVVRHVMFLFLYVFLSVLLSSSILFFGFFPFLTFPLLLSLDKKMDRSNSTVSLPVSAPCASFKIVNNTVIQLHI